MSKYNTLHYLAALLKKYGIKHIVASPGAQNSNFNRFLQENESFSCHSVVDERSAGYVALGIARETNEPVALTCTGATASRNYLSALTEAYYSSIPIIAITFFPYTNTKYNLAPQFVDRSISQNDIKELSIELPLIKSQEDISKCLVLLNSALFTAKNKKIPVHINCPSIVDFEMTYELPEDVWFTQYVKNNIKDFSEKLINKKIGIFIGEHSTFTQEEENALSNFAVSWNCPVFCDHTSQYKGKNKILISQAANMKRFNQYADIIIDTGRICADYSYPGIFGKAEKWKISEDGNFKSRLSMPIKYLFDCEEKTFFETLKNPTENKTSYFNDVKEIVDSIIVPELPLCNPFIAQTISKLLPKNSTLHLSILNSLRSMDFFDVDKSIRITSNVGGFGIDGALSTIIGHSLASPHKMHFGIVGDLAFFYDMNALGLREITNNIRIILVNNNRGEEFRLNSEMEKNFGNTTDTLIAAAGHYKGGAKGWAESCNFEYMSAKNKEEFETQINDFCTKEGAKPILFEVFTSNEDEQNGMNLMKNSNKNELEEGAINIYRKVRNLIK